MLKKYISKLFLIFMFCFLYFPIIYLIFYSFNSGDSMTSFEGFSFIWYRELFNDKDMFLIILNTLILALISAMISTFIGTMGAIAIYFIRNKKLENTLYSLNSVLLVSPDVIIGISLLIMFTLFSIPFGFTSVLLAHISFSIPVVVIMVLPKLNNMNYNIINASKDLGAKDSQVILKVIVPSIIPGIMAGFFTAFTYSLDDFAVTFFVTGNGFQTLAIDIYSQARMGISLSINALSSIIFIITFILAVAYYFITNNGGKNEVN